MIMITTQFMSILEVCVLDNSSTLTNKELAWGDGTNTYI